jgi:hypothetical protein
VLINVPAVLRISVLSNIDDFRYSHQLGREDAAFYINLKEEKKKVAFRKSGLEPGTR